MGTMIFLHQDVQHLLLFLPDLNHQVRARGQNSRTDRGDFSWSRFNAKQSRGEEQSRQTGE
jgi:hypothetical protein